MQIDFPLVLPIFQYFSGFFDIFDTQETLIFVGDYDMFTTPDDFPANRTFEFYANHK